MDRKRRAERAPVGAGLLTKKKKTGKAGKEASSLINKWQAVRKVEPPHPSFRPHPVARSLPSNDCPRVMMEVGTVRRK